MYVITGATGNVGKVVAIKLLEQGRKVRAIARDAGKLKELASLGAEISPGSLDDAEFLSSTFKGATAVFVMNPLDVQAENVRKFQDRNAQAVFSALKSAETNYVVHLSSVGADLPERTGPIAGLYRAEQLLNDLKSAHILHLRPSYFMENFLASIPMIKTMGINGDAIRPDLQMPIIATRDIGPVAAKHLLKLDFTGKTIRYLLGQRDLTMTEATTILGKAIGKPDLPYVQFSYEDAIQAMIQAGLSADVARSYAEMSQALNEGRVVSIPRAPENTTPTSFETFAAEVFAPAYNG